jgi:hypothetical protein
MIFEFSKPFSQEGEVNKKTIKKVETYLEKDSFSLGKPT